ncbi:hypothetical protein FACS1894191_8550 [Clostridia bacterium]|nr:hypothetical protein FACS1894191_8550 [Clostridia bacterium]
MDLLKAITDADFGGEKIFLPEVMRTASRGILTDNGGMALMRVGGLKCHKLPGGGLEAGEDPRQAFIREVREETGYVSEITGELGYVDEHKSKSSFYQRSYCYVGKALFESGQELTQNERNLDFGLEWVTAEEAERLLAGYAKSFEEYTIRFMLLRDLTIVREAMRLGEV